MNKFKTTNPIIKFQFRVPLQVVDLCAHYSNKRYHVGTEKETGSAATFIKDAIFEKLVKNGVPVNYLKSIFKMS